MRATCLHHLMLLNLLTHKYFVNGTTYKDFRYYVSFPMSLLVVQVHLLEWESKFDTRARAYKTRFEFDVFISLYRVLTKGGYTKIKKGKDGKAAEFQRSALTLSSLYNPPPCFVVISTCDRTLFYACLYAAEREADQILRNASVSCLPTWNCDYKTTQKFN